MAYTLDRTYEERLMRFRSQRFGMYLAMAGIVMLFAALTSAYIVRRSAGNWLEFTLPTIFYWNTLVILTSSVTLHLSWTSFKRGLQSQYRIFLIATFVLGLLFLVMQYLGWQQMTAEGLYLQVNPSASFIYVISGVHAAHIIGGVGALIVAIAHAIKLKFKVTSIRKHRFELVVIYWHFVDLLWLYLLVFFIFI